MSSLSNTGLWTFKAQCKLMHIYHNSDKQPGWVCSIFLSYLLYVCSILSLVSGSVSPSDPQTKIFNNFFQ